MPTVDDARKLRAAVKRAADLDFVFESISSPEWIAPLATEGLLFERTPTEYGEEFVTYGRWPGSRYLLRMTSVAPAEVSATLGKLPTTDNPVIQCEYGDVVLALPPRFAAKHFKSIAEWLTASRSPRLPLIAVQLVERFASELEPAAWLPLVRALFELVGPSKEREVLRDRRSSRLIGGLYELLFKKVEGAVVPLERAEWLEVIGDLLETGLGPAPEGDAVAEDHSYYWRAELEHADSSPSRDETDVLVDALIAGADTPWGERYLLENDGARLRARRWAIFWRVYLRLLAMNIEAVLSEAERVLAEIPLRPLLSLHAERWRLAEAVLGQHDDAWRTEYLERVRDGLLGATNRADEADEGERSEVYYYRVLMMLEEVLPPELHTELARLRERRGELQHPERFWSSTGGMWVGAKSPIEEDELRGKSIPEIVHLLVTWTPSGSPLEDTRDGLAGTLTEVVEDDARRFVEEWEAFIGVEAIYVKGILHGLKKWLARGEALPWEAFLRFADWIAGMKADTYDRKGEGDSQDEDDDVGAWHLSRRVLAEVLSTAMQHASAGLDEKHSDVLWDVLARLAMDSDPRPDEEASSLRGGLDPLTIALSSVRGEAIEAVFQYAVWKLRESRADEGDARVELPERVRELLENLLRTSGLLSVHARIAQATDWLVRVDADWLRIVRGLLWPTSKAKRKEWVAAWGAFVMYGRPHPGAREVLIEEYEEALGERGYDPSATEMWRDESVGGRTAQHVAVYVMWGTEAAGGFALLRRLFSSRQLEGKRSFTGFLGRQLHNELGERRNEIVDRVTASWEFLERNNLLSYASEESWLAEFGWWHASGALTDAWAIERLERIVRAGIVVEPAGECVERLVGVSDELLLRALTVVRGLVESSDAGWGMSIWMPHAKALVERGEATGSAMAQEVARDIRNDALARGLSL